MRYSGRLKKPVLKIKYNSYGLCLTYQLPGTAHNKAIKNPGAYWKNSYMKYVFRGGNPLNSMAL